MVAERFNSRWSSCYSSYKPGIVLEV